MYALLQKGPLYTQKKMKHIKIYTLNFVCEDEDNFSNTPKPPRPPPADVHRRSFHGVPQRNSLYSSFINYARARVLCTGRGSESSFLALTFRIWRAFFHPTCFFAFRPFRAFLLRDWSVFSRVRRATQH